MSRRVANIIAIASIVILIITVWWNRFLPLQDYPEWLFQSTLIKAAISHSQQTVDSYKIKWFPLPPNSLVSILLVVLQFIASPNVAGKLLLTLYILLFSFGWWYFFSRLYNYHPLRWLGIVFVFNYFFFLGYFSYILGLSILMFTVGWFNQGQHFSWRVIVGTALSSILLYTVHGIPYFIFCIVIARRLLLKTEDVITVGQKIAIIVALLPSIVLVALYLVFNDTSAQWVLFPSFILQLTTWAYALSFFNRLIPFKQALPISFMNIAIAFFLAGMLFHFRKRLIPSTVLKIHFPIAMVMLAFVLLNPVTRIGELFGINQRFVLPAILFVFGSLTIVSANQKIENAVVILGLVMSMFYFVQMFQFNKNAESVYEAVKPSYDKAKTPLVIARGYVEEFDKDFSQRLSAGIRTMIHFRRFFDIENIPRNFVTFGSALVRVQENKMDPQIISLDSCVDKYQYAHEAICALDSKKSVLNQRCDYIFVIGNEVVIREYHDYLASCYGKELFGNNWLILTK